VIDSVDLAALDRLVVVGALGSVLSRREVAQ
jgi:hypothetical protein